MTVTFLESERDIAVRVPPIESLDDFRRWALSDDFPERGKITYADGRVEADMSPQSRKHHAGVITAIASELARLADEDEIGEVDIDSTLVTLLDVGVASEPDVVYVSYESLRTGRVEETVKADRDDEAVELVGPPDLIVQVVSGSSVTRDTVTLRDAYERGGVGEYWIVDGRGPAISVTPLRHDGGRFVEVPADADGWFACVAFGREFRLTRTRVEGDRWRYRLESRGG